MSSYKTNLWRLFAGKLLLLMLAMATACSESEEPEMTKVPGKDSGAKAYLSITIPYDMYGNLSRSGGDTPSDDKHPMEPEYGWDDIYENEINLEDLVIYIFQVDNTGKSTLRFYGYSNKDFKDELGFGTMSVEGNFGRYVMVNLDVHEWPIEQSDNINLKIVLMCNKDGLGGTNTGVYSYPRVTKNNMNTFTINNLLSKSGGQNNTFSINAEWRPRPEGNNDYIPERDPDKNPDDSGKEKKYFRHIPMFGYLDVSIPGAELLKSQPYDRIDLSVMWALRSVAKIEVIDNIERKEGNEYPKIEKVTIQGRPIKGCLIPWEYTDANTYSNGKQVETISLPFLNQSGSNYLTASYLLNDFKDKAIWDYVTKGTETIVEKTTVKQLFRVYTPEMSADRLKDTMITVTVANGDGTSTDYTMSLTEYTRGTVTQTLFKDPLVRNHIYRIRVKKALSPQQQNSNFAAALWSRSGESGFTPIFEASEIGR